MQIRDDRNQDLGGVIAKGERRKPFRGRQQRGGEPLPFETDLLSMLLQKIGKTHESTGEGKLQSTLSRACYAQSE